MRIQLLKMKADLKVLALQIRQLKSTRKQHRNGSVPGLGTAQSDFRIKHIAYCLLRGRTMEQIEPKLRDPNCYEHTWVRKQAAALVAKTLEEANATASAQP